MRCDSCGADLRPDARFCSACGTMVELGSVLGVGTDLPPVVTSRPAPPARPAPTAPAPARPEPDRDQPARVDPHPGFEEPPPRGSFSVGQLAAMAATFVVLTVIGTFTLSQLFGSDAPEPPAASSAPTTGQESGSAPESSTAAPSPTATPSQPATPPDGARRCSRSGDDAVATAYSGNRDTSCAFTNAVRKAYREAGAPVHPTSFRTYSPVTKKWYDVTCKEGAFVRCASANGAAVVFLGP